MTTMKKRYMLCCYVVDEVPFVSTLFLLVFSLDSLVGG